MSSSSEIRPPAVPGTDTSWLRAVADDAALFDRSSSAERVADVLRRRITEGQLRPGTQLSEELLKEALQVSRNTLREAFRLLTHEGLLVHRMHRGVFVPDLTEDDLVDLYRLRRVLECDVVRGLTDLEPDRLDPLRADLEASRAAAGSGDWIAVGTANMRFHRHLVGLAGSTRIDEIIGRLLAELRLLFHVIATPQALHEPYIARNQALLELLEAGECERAADELHQYMLDSEARLLAAFRARG
ncbi:DNA-binding GntR family transcriptional regulator [Kribbella amoyensis]|uniref:DNA-binding GntR family transcriptional regulator n=1 Tax=Kribbella amoyensis TaxID=996641 RepID=A0A561BM98_9ACTN|nr:GntR family transcriptional regulator [Kribbella amoyensis]TWD79952.1 DNA-binding GntR family transcriptional regulator [Kribbella amoyensis]